jgi:hypothetical protein
MKEKENKFSLLDALALLSGIFAAVAIVYTAYWYVDINEKDEEVVISEMEEVYVYNAYCEEDVGYSVIKMMFVDSVAKQPLFFEEFYRYTEPMKVITRNVRTSNGKNKTYKQFYFSTELKAQTAFACYKEDFGAVSVNENVITLVSEK